MAVNPYRGSDMVRTGFVTGQWELAATPSYVAANLNNRGVPARPRLNA